MLLVAIRYVSGAANVRSLPARVSIGECADSSVTDASTSFFDASLQFGTLPSAATVQAETDMTIARLTTIKYGTNFKVVTENFAKEQYVLTQCGTTQPTDQEVEALAALPVNFTRKHFEIPLQTVVAEGTVQLAFFEALGLHDRVSYVSEYASGSCWQKAIGCGAQLESSWGGNATLLALQRNGADAVFMDCSSTSPVDCSNVNSRTNGIHFAASQDIGLLHAAEHIKFIAAFFNKENDADTIFANTVQAYANVAVVPTSSPVVAWISYSSWGEAEFILSQATYKTTLVTKAGGSNKDGDAMKVQLGNALEESLAVSSVPEAGKTFTLKLSSYNGSKQLASNAFFGALADVDAVIDETYAYNPTAYTLTDFLAGMGLTNDSNLPFVQNNMIFRVDGTLSETNGMDWFESRVANPHLAVGGLVRVLHQDSSQEAMYFRNLANGELPNVLFASNCTNDLIVCSNDSQAAALPLLVAVADSNDVSLAAAICMSRFIFVLLFSLAILSTRQVC
jgi:hypothetical protein